MQPNDVEVDPHQDTYCWRPMISLDAIQEDKGGWRRQHVLHRFHHSAVLEDLKRMEFENYVFGRVRAWQWKLINNFEFLSQGTPLMVS